MTSFSNSSYSMTPDELALLKEFEKKDISLAKRLETHHDGISVVEAATKRERDDAPLASAAPCACGRAWVVPSPPWASLCSHFGRRVAVVGYLHSLFPSLGALPRVFS